MAGMTDTAFRRLVKRHGGCGLVVTEMVSAEGLVRGIDRTLEYAEYTEEERPISIQIFGGDPSTMAWAPTSSTSTWGAPCPRSPGTTRAAV
jgi:tRNA-dihydrouridine synthase B